MQSHESTETVILDLLGAIPGVISARCLDAGQRLRVVEEEERYEAGAVLPVRNIGVRLLRNRQICCVLLKDGRFRLPGVPTVYLVEEEAPEGSPHVVKIEGKRYAIVGQEVVDGAPGFDEPTIPLESSFVIFPERRSGPRVPCHFILPPISFPELERKASTLGITGILSISPSLAVDAYLRGLFGFPVTNALATLLIGCSPR